MSAHGTGRRWDAIKLAPNDNVATVLRDLDAGVSPSTAGAESEDVPLKQPIRRGHKFALTAIQRGDTVFKYGAAIGIATTDIMPGAHVHLHNLEGFAGRDARNARAGS